MNKAKMVFVEERELMPRLNEHDINVSGKPLFHYSAGCNKNKMSNFPPLILNQDMSHFSEIASSVKEGQMNCIWVYGSKNLPT